MKMFINFLIAITFAFAVFSIPCVLGGKARNAATQSSTPTESIEAS